MAAENAGLFLKTPTIRPARDLQRVRFILAIASSPVS
jgi:hypothetical protein